MNTLVNGWFSELSPDDRDKYFPPVSAQNGAASWKSDQLEIGQAWPGQAFSLKVEEVLFSDRSKYQDILVFRSQTYGNVLVLDGVIQCTERDEFAYQEMLAHLPLCCHPNPKNVLIIGGGDGGILREVLKHPEVEAVTMCEIDEVVIDVSKRYLPKMASGFGHPKLRLHIGDGHKFLSDNQNQFDVIITDSSDPLGPAESLFGESYYKLVRDALTENGVLASQGESQWLHLDLIKHMVSFCRTLYPQVGFASGCVPSYPSGVIGYLLCSKDKDQTLQTPKRVLSPEAVEAMGLRYYNSQVHQAAFVLPQFVKEMLNQN